MITVKEFAEKLWIELGMIMRVMMQNKIMGGLNTNLDFDTACLLGEELWTKVNKEQDTISVESILEWDLKAILDLDKDSANFQKRAPIVTIMGHVDHGKTSLLDYLRKTNVVWGEAWGITQSIGASTVIYNGQEITFIDTPGHELFTTMRARGAKITDIAVIVVAADDGLKPQTIESINHAKEANVPIIIAITKIDKPDASYTEQIKWDIGNYWLIPEERGGDVSIIAISAKTWQWIDDLLEHILLQAEILNLNYNPDRDSVSVVLDAKKSSQQGIETSLIIMTGTLKVGDVLAIHNTFGRVKRMIDRTGKSIKKAHWWQAVQILGINQTPEPWRIAEWVKSEKEAAQKIAIIQEKTQSRKSTTALHELISQIETGKKATVKLILKADGPTALEALIHSIDNITCPSNVEIKKVHTDVGQFTQSDLSLAEASGALLVGFNIKTHASIKKKSEQLKIVLKTYDIIYELIEYIENIVKGLIEIETEEVAIGTLQILAIFYRKGKDMVIGGKVTKGKITNGCDFRIHRENEIIGKGQITSLQKDKQSIKEIAQWYECGMKVKSSKKLEEWDTLEFYVIQEVV